MKLTRKERTLNPQALVTYKRPTILAGYLTNYRTLAHNITQGCGKSQPCNRCKLCGRYKESPSMVEETTTISSQSGKTFHLVRQLNCKDFGIYVATCRKCLAQYVGQTITPFSTRWNTHRSVWKSGSTEKNDHAALKLHYVEHHPGSQNTSLANAFALTFVDKPKNVKDIDILESGWISRLSATININKTALPMIR